LHFIEPANYISHYSDCEEATSISPLQSLLRSSSYSYLHYTDPKKIDPKHKPSAFKHLEEDKIYHFS
jgi:hypothetical protein